MASFKLRMVSMSDWSMNCHIFRTLRDLEEDRNSQSFVELCAKNDKQMSVSVSVCFSYNLSPARNSMTPL